MSYSSADILVRTIMTTKSGLAADKVVNDWAFHFAAGTTPADSDLDNLQDAIDAFYNTTGGINPVAYYIGQNVDRTVTHKMDFYTISAPPLGSPRYTNDWIGPSTPGATTDLPAEVCGVLSFHADLTGVVEESGTTRPRARKRGRVYVGPLTYGAINNNSGKPILEPNFTQAMREGAGAMATAAAADGWTWSVWSRKDTTLYEVVGGWTDNAPDTQRRRGPKATARVTYTV